MTPLWLHELSIAMLAAGVVFAIVVAVDEFRHPQRMAIMNVVWPVTALFGSVITLWGYFAYGRIATDTHTDAANRGGERPPAKRHTPFPIAVGIGGAHCGSGCTLGDIAAEWLAVTVPGVAVLFGWHSIFADKIFAVWVIDYIFAYGFGIVFQYFTIAPMRGLAFWPGITAAAKADTLSLTAWQIGMYGFMALAQFYLFQTLIGTRLEVASPEFWFMMQIAMLCGFATSYPVNWWLIRAGIKAAM